MRFSATYKDLAGMTIGRTRLALGSSRELTVFNSHQTPKRDLGAFQRTVRELDATFTWLAPGAVGEFFESPSSFKGGPYALLTFDDGFRNNIDSARILSALGISAIYFVATGFVISDDPWNYYCRQICRGYCPDHGEAGARADAQPLSPSDVSQLMELGHEVGSHTVSHVLIESLDEEALRAELQDSATAIERWTGVRPRYFASPFDTRRMSPSTGATVLQEYERHFTTLDLSNRRFGGELVFRTNIEFSWRSSRRDYAARVRWPERMRWRLQNREFVAAQWASH